MDRLVQSLFESPPDMGDWRVEYSAFADSCALTVRAERCMVRVRGERRAEMLNGLVTNQVEGLRGVGRHAMLLSPKGRVLTDLRIFPFADSMLLDLPRGGHANLLAAFQKYLPPIYATYEDASNSLSLLGLYGPKAAEAASEVVEEVPDQHLGVAEVEIGSNVCLVVRNRRLAGDGVELFVPRDAAPEIVDRLLPAVRARGGRAVGSRALEVVRVEWGVPTYGVDISESNLAQETGLEEEAISYDKGCYLGQEVVARVHFRGHLNRQLGGLRFADQVPPAGALLRDEGGKEIGAVTSAVESPEFGPIGLGYVRREIEMGASVYWEVGGHRGTATAVALPFRGDGI
jgi:folate-binding protein YgfZ